MEEMVQRKFVTEDGQEVPRKNVCFKGNSPCLFYVGEKGERIVSDIPLIELEVTMSPELDPEISSLS